MHDKIAQYVVGATRNRYVERAQPTSFKKGTTKANPKGLTGIAVGSKNDVYDVHISDDFYPVQTKENPHGRGTISCTCMEFTMKNPSGTLPFKLDPCKHVLGLAQRWVNRAEIGGAHAKPTHIRPTHIEIPSPTWVEQETAKAYLAKIAGVKKWWSKKHVILEEQTTYLTLWIANQEGVRGKQVVLT